MEEQDKFNQASGNEPMKQPIEQPTADMDSKPTANVTAQSTSAQTDDSGIVWDPKRPECLDLKYYKKYWMCALRHFILILICIMPIFALIIYVIDGEYDIATGFIFLLPLTLSPIILTLMLRKAFRQRKPNAPFLFRATNLYNFFITSTWTLLLLIPAFLFLTSSEAGHISFWGLCDIDYSRTANLIFRTICVIACLCCYIEGILKIASALVDQNNQDAQILQNAFPKEYQNYKSRDVLSVICVATLPIIGFLTFIVIIAANAA